MKSGMIDIPGIGPVKVTTHSAPSITYKTSTGDQYTYDPFSRGTENYTQTPAQHDDIIASLENP
jgi:hypothetical protein